MSNRENRSISEKVNRLGKVLLVSGAARFYHNGDGAGFVWRFWHPVAWVCVPLLILASVILQGVPATIRNPHELGLRINPWFIENPDRLHWG